MIRYYLFLAFFILCTAISRAQPSPELLYSAQISPDSAMESVFLFASDSLQGRETGTAGQKRAAAYISKKFFEYGLQPLPGHADFVQHHSLSLRVNSEMNMEVHQKFYLYLDDYFYTSGYRDTTFILHSIIFAGYGISDSSYDDYKGMDTQGKALLFYEGEPPARREKNFLNGEPVPSAWTNDWKNKWRVIYEKKPGIVFIVTKNPLFLADSLLDERKVPELYQLNKSPYSIPVVFITEDMALNFFPEHEQYRFARTKKAIDRKRVPASFAVNSDAVITISSEPDKLTGENIVGMIEGSEKKEEYIFITAHYDHLGIKDSVTYPGADDNAGGSAAVLELSRVFSKAKREGFRLKRSLVFMLVSGEEMGLLGSSFFVSNPPLALEDIVSNLNIDMIGRTDSLHDSLGIRDYVYVIGADKLSDDLHRINEENNARGPKLLLDYLYNNPEDPNQYYYRSDQYHFARHQIPVIFYFNGVHADYHKPTDTVDKIDFMLLCKRAQLVFLTAWDLAYREARIRVNKKERDGYPR